MKKGKDTPPGIIKQKSGNYFVQVRIYYNTSGKYGPFSVGTYPTLEQAIKAKKIATELTGTTQDSKKKVRESKIREELNKFRLTIGLKPLKQKI